MGLLIDLIKAGAGLAFILLVLFIILSGRFGQFTPLFLILTIFIVLGIIVFYIWRYKQTTMQMKEEPKESHWNYLKKQVMENNIPGILTQDNDLLHKPKIRFSFVTGDHHLVGFRDADGNPVTGFYDIEHDFNRGVLYDENIASDNKDALIKGIEILEQVKKGEKLKVAATPQLVAETIKEIQVPEEKNKEGERKKLL